MTEAEWLACADPTPMLEFLRGNASDRKVRLFAVACCRRIWHLITEELSRQCVELAETFADEGCGVEELQVAHAAATAISERQHEDAYPTDAPDDMIYWLFEVGCDASAAAEAATTACSRRPLGLEEAEYRAAGITPQPPGSHSTYEYAARACAHQISPQRAELCSWEDTPGRHAAKRDEAHAQANLLRDIFGNPFRPVAFETGWRTSTVVALASGIYSDRSFDRLPILADALEDAGCDAAELLAHLRGNGPHVRGCWALDLVLGKS